ncbi:hypothetical protein ABT299_13125 [Spirillospora sp. NPDC000708]
MSDFDDLVSAERRRFDEQAAAQAAQREDRLRSEPPRWQQAVARVQDVLAASVRHLQDAGVPPEPVLEWRNPWQRFQTYGFESVGRVVTIGHRWPLGPFALDAQARVYKPRRSERLETGHVNTWASHTMNKKRRKARLRTGLAPDQQVMWGSADDLVALDPAEGARSGRIFCFGIAGDGTPLLVSGDSDLPDQPLEPYLAKTVAARISANASR